MQVLVYTTSEAFLNRVARIYVGIVCFCKSQICWKCTFLFVETLLSLGLIFEFYVVTALCSWFGLMKISGYVTHTTVAGNSTTQSRYENQLRNMWTWYDTCYANVVCRPLTQTNVNAPVVCRNVNCWHVIVTAGLIVEVRCLVLPLRFVWLEGNDWIDG